MQITDWERVKRGQRRKQWLWMGVGLLVLVGLIKQTRHWVVLDNFGVVEPGLIYRSGQLQDYQVAKLIRTYGIKTVINTREPDAPAGLMDAERRACEANGCEMVRIPMPGDGRGEYYQFDQGLEILTDPDQLPVLVHCARGTHRTGALVGSYRVLEQGWSAQQVINEMKRYRFEGEEHALVPHLKQYWWLKGVETGGGH